MAATSGKGTVCYYIESILRAHSKHTGLLVSPHVYSIRERIQINGRFISESSFVKNLNFVLQTYEACVLEPRYFEAMTVMGFTAFANIKNLDYTVIETGFGGLFDTTNTIRRKDKLCILGQIGYDHTAVLGETLEEIATQKAGIIHTGNAVIALRQDPRVNKVFEEAAKEKGVDIIWVENTSGYQEANRNLAIAAARFIATRDKWQFDRALARQAIEATIIPGRFEELTYHNTAFILDGAHNPQKLGALADRIRHEKKYPATILLSVGKRKDITACLKALQSIAKRVIVTEYSISRQDIPVQALSADIIIDRCKKLGIEATKADSPLTALQDATTFSDPVVVTGSFYLVGDIGQLLK